VKRPAAAALIVALASSACIGGGDDPREAAEELAAIAASADIAEYKATYRFEISGELAPAVRYELEVVQLPPTSFRHVETTTVGAEGEEITIPSWRIQNADGFFACARYEEGVRCIEQPALVGMFGLTSVDDVFDRVRDPQAFEEVEELEGARRVAGERARCFRAVPAPATPPPIRSPQPRFTPETFTFELCYASDGILLWAKRTITGEIPANLEGRTENVLEATSLERAVSPEDVALPGPVATVEDVRG
jgi:hypothetical protein